MRFILSVAVIQLAICGTVVPQATSPRSVSASGPLESSLVRAMLEYDAAQLHGDRAELERLVAPDYLIIRPNGVGDRASLIHSVAGPGVTTDPFTIVQPFTRNYGSTVVAGGWCDLHGRENGKPWEQRTRFADVWTKRKGRWWVVMTTLTPSDSP